jgi:prepilin-type N-terminal cleavage/methylation domain-containing protein
MKGNQDGFTLIELLVTLTITVAIMTVVLSAVDLNANITRVQSDVSDLQQSTRVAQRDMQRLVRMSGRGGLPRNRSVLVGPPEIAVDDTQNVSDKNVGGEPVLDGTDILTIRGALTSPVFRVDAADPTTFQQAGNTATLQIDSVTKSAFDQPLSALHALLDEDTGTTTPEAILLVGSQGETVYGVVEMTNIQFQTVTLDVQNQARQIERAILTVSIDADAGGHAGEYLALSSLSPTAPDPTHLPNNLTSVAFAAILEEYRFFVRKDFSIPGDETSLPSPKLARARMIPGSVNTLHSDGLIDIADNIYDLQVAFGIDLDGNGRIDIEDPAGDPLPTNADDWLYNDPADDKADIRWQTATLRHVRLTILGEAQTPDRQYISPAIDDLEDHVYDEPEFPSNPDQLVERRHRRRMIQSTIDLRNL